MEQSVRSPVSRMTTAISLTRVCSSAFAHLRLNENDMRRLCDLTVGFAKLAEGMRQQAELEMNASAEWFKWLKYGTSSRVLQTCSEVDDCLLC